MSKINSQSHLPPTWLQFQMNRAIISEQIYFFTQESNQVKSS